MNKLSVVPKRKPSAGYRFIQLPLTILDWPISDSEFRAWCAIFRLTYGYRKFSDALSMSQICKISRQSERTAIRAVAELERCGLLRVVRQHRKCNVYEPLFPRFIDCQIGTLAPGP